MPCCVNIATPALFHLKYLGLKDHAGKLLSQVPRCIEKIAIN